MRHAMKTVTDLATGKVYPIPAGGSDNTPPPVDPPADPSEPAEPEPDDGLGDAGKKALAEERAARKAAEKEAKRAKTLEAELEKFREDAMSEQERAIATARKEAADEARTEALSTVNRKLFTAEVRAAAAGKVADQELLADPDVAMRLLGLDEVPVTNTGDVDSEAISAALDGLVERKPYLAVSATRTTGDVDQGARSNGSVGDTPSMNDLLRSARG